MTDRVQTLTVALEDDIRVDDVEYIVNAIRMIKYVKHVELGKPVNMDDWSARIRVGSKWQDELLDLMKKMRGKND